MITKHYEGADRADAADVFLDQRRYRLSPEDFDVFVQTLDCPPEPGPKLKALLARTPAWKR